MPIRHAMTFKPQRQQTVVFNRTYVVQQQNCKHAGGLGGIGWAFFGLSALGSIFSGLSSSGLFSRQTAITQQTANQQNSQEFANLKKVAKDFGYELINNGNDYTAYKPDKSALPITGDYTTVLNSLLKVNGEPEPEKTVTTPPEGKGGSEIITSKDTYGIKKEAGVSTLKIDKGYTWYNIATAKYDIPEGINPRNVALALAAANSDNTDSGAAMEQAKQGIYFKVGDTIKLPDSLTINNKTIKLKSEHEKANVNAENYNFASNAEFWSAKIEQVGDKWYVTKNGQIVGNAYATEQAAQEAKAQLENQQQQNLL